MEPDRSRPNFKLGLSWRLCLPVLGYQGLGDETDPGAEGKEEGAEEGRGQGTFTNDCWGALSVLPKAPQRQRALPPAGEGSRQPLQRRSPPL